MSNERKQMIRAFGAELVEVGNNDFAGAVEIAKKIAEEQNGYHTNQFSSRYNVESQYKLGQEINEQIGKVDAVICGVGSGGCIAGIPKALKELNPYVKVIALEPSESPIITNTKFGGNYEIGGHDIQGIGDGFIPDVVNLEHIDETILVSSADAMDGARELAKKYGIIAGISAGSNYVAALRLETRFEKIVTLLCDRGDRYLSMSLYK